MRSIPTCEVMNSERDSEACGFLDDVLESWELEPTNGNLLILVSPDHELESLRRAPELGCRQDSRTRIDC